MTLKNKSIVVLLSGGLDSSTVTGIAKKSEAKIFGLSFDYGQRHKKELNSASIIAKTTSRNVRSDRLAYRDKLEFLFFS